MGYQFQYPQAFLLLGLIPILFLFYAGYRRWRKKAILKTGKPELVTALFQNHSSKKEIIKISLLLLAFALGCLAVANPRKPDASSGESRKGIDIVIALDVSNSMKATDIAPDRLSRAKQFISKLIDNLQDDRLGLVVFAGNAYAQMPLTFDRDAARMYVAAANPNNIAAQGTSIGDAFDKCNILFGDETDRFRSVVLITDGETHDEDALKQAKQMAEKGVMINTVGIGSAQGSTIVDSAGNAKRDASGQVVVSRLNEDILQQIANVTRGRYIHLESADAAVGEVLSQYTQIDKKALGDTSLYTYTSFYAWLTLPMLLMLLAEIFLPDWKRKKS